MLAGLSTGMRGLPFLLLLAGALAGCEHRDPIDRLMARLQKEAKTIVFTSYPFRPVNLPTNSSPQQVVATLASRGDFQATNVVIVEIREVQTPEDMHSSRHYTAVLVDSSAGQKVVLIRPMSSDWYFKIYDSK
jgi:hypothetical protein